MNRCEGGIKLGHYAVTVLGQDRPAIIAEVTAVLAELGGNLEDSTMTLLRGHFAMVLLVSCELPAQAVRHRLQEATEGLTFEVAEVPAGSHIEPEPSGLGYVLTVHGADRPGIVSAITRVLADVDGNITDLQTRLTGSLYVLIADVDLPPRVDVAALMRRLSSVAEGLGVETALRPADPDVL